MKVPRALLLALALLQAIGLTDYVRRLACDEECATDGCDDKGLGNCVTGACHCPSALSMTETQRAVTEEAPPRTAATIVFAAPEQLLESPDPREILHVPKPYAV